jgi:hypothetical protein
MRGRRIGQQLCHATEQWPRRLEELQICGFRCNRCTGYFPIGRQRLDDLSRDSAFEQIAQRRLVLVQNVHELRLSVALGPHMLQNGGQNLRFDLQRASYQSVACYAHVVADTGFDFAPIRSSP